MTTLEIITLIAAAVLVTSTVLVIWECLIAATESADEAP